MTTTIKYPKILRPILEAGFSRRQEAGFTYSDSRSGKIYTKKIAQNQPTFINVTFKFNSQEAVMFQSWYQHTLKMGLLPFMMPLMTEWGEFDYECQFVPDSLLPASKQGYIWTYTAEIMIRDYGIPKYFPADIASWPEYAGNDAMKLFDEIVNSQLNKV